MAAGTGGEADSTGGEMEKGEARERKSKTKMGGKIK